MRYAVFLSTVINLQRLFDRCTFDRDSKDGITHTDSLSKRLLMNIPACCISGGATHIYLVIEFLEKVLCIFT